MIILKAVGNEHSELLLGVAVARLLARWIARVFLGALRFCSFSLTARRIGFFFVKVRGCKGLARSLL